MQNYGQLKLVSLPIGNIKDITLRALEVLEEAKYVAAEDTREVGKFFAMREISKPIWISYRDQNHHSAAPKIIELLKQGEDVVLVSDRGTPTISDPGFRLVREVKDEGIEVVSIPGPSAVISALSISGLPTDKFVFLGFLPRQQGKQRKILANYVELDVTFIIYESPYRVVKLLRLIQEEFGDIQVAAAKELTKMHEKVYSGKVSEVLEELESSNLKGEWVVLGNRYYQPIGVHF